jgi:hypothetical protein
MDGAIEETRGNGCHPERSEGSAERSPDWFRLHYLDSVPNFSIALRKRSDGLISRSLASLGMTMRAHNAAAFASNLSSLNSQF